MRWGSFHEGMDKSLESERERPYAGGTKGWIWQFGGTPVCRIESFDLRAQTVVESVWLISGGYR